MNTNEIIEKARAECKYPVISPAAVDAVNYLGLKVEA